MKQGGERRRWTPRGAMGPVPLAAVVDGARSALPTGNLLPPDIWRQRHRVIVGLLWLHIPALAVFGTLMGIALEHVLDELLIVALFAVAATWDRPGQTPRAAAATVGLVSASAILVHFSGGYVEAHFHFFVVLGVITLYQSWVPFLLALGYVVVHHSVLGVLAPTFVFNHPDAWRYPVKWALIHGGFVLAASAAYLAAWRLTEYQALHDPLTRLANRALLHDRIEHATARAGRRGDALGVVLLDLDDFKQVNDSLGHGAGDTLLVALAQRLRAVVRSSDTIARLGGDEFAVVIEDARDEAAVRAVAERLLRVFDTPFVIADRQMTVRASIGVVVVLGSGYGQEELLRRADVAMYRAKGAGKGGLAYFTEDSAPAPAVRVASAG